MLHDPWNPHLALFPFVFFLVTAAAIAGGDVRLLPFGAFAASLVVQLHLPTSIPVLLTSIWAIAGLVVVQRFGMS